jgi:ATP-dependent RNA helicase RhlB
VNQTAEQPLTDLAFTSLPLADSLLQGLQELGITHCTPIQADALPMALAGRDVAGQGRTGTGKTAAFLLATMQRLLNDKDPASQGASVRLRALILAPTRELAIQIHKDAVVIGKETGLRLALAYGGVDYEKQRKQIQDGVDILIGTPGRIIDYYKQQVFTLNYIQVVVLDEADRMFDLGFIKDVRFLLRRMPDREHRLGMLFSATLSYKVTELAYEHMNDPVMVRVEADKKTADGVTQTIYFPANEEKIRLLLGLLKQMDPKRTMIFLNTKFAAERVGDYLTANGFENAMLSGDVPQNKRQRLMHDFHAGKIPILVATDVAARGLHIPDVSHVINFDLPQDAEDYVHRIGRTARLGASGDAISFACETYAFTLPEIEGYLGHEIPSCSITPELLVEPIHPPRRRRAQPSGRSGGRPHRPRDYKPSKR